MSLEQTVDNLEIRYANAVTFVGTSNTMIDTTTGRIQTKGIQHNSNVITDVSGPHGRVAPTLKKYPEIVFDDTSKMDTGEGGTTSGLIFKQAGYTVTASSTHSSNGRVPYRAFNGDHTTGWICDSGSWNSGTNVYQGGRGIGGYSGEWIKLELPHKIKVETMYIEADLNSGRRPLTGKLLGSDDDSTWVIIKDLTSIPNQNRNTLNIGSTVAYKYIAFLTETIPSGNDTVWIDEIEYYGYEEYTPAGDHSVDTTFMSRFNNPQLTGVQVLVDGATGVGTNQISGGPDPSGNQSTYVTDGKYWTLNGTLTSNLSVEANTFLEGDQPHAVSVWFNSSNLEANVSNTCVFSVSDQEKLDSVNLDLQSNTWHNLTYAYQGEGGSRVTYLDGRKVAEDQAEDTFGEYPPFAMTGYSQSGYVVSASSDTYSTTGFYAWKAFNDVQANEGWHTGTGNGATNHFAANAGGSVYDASLSGGTSSPLSGNLGEWVKLELPHKLVVDYLRLKARGTSSASTQSPKDFKILGSNDDINWDILESFTSVPYSMTGENHVVGATKGYKYIAFLVTRLQRTDQASCVVGEIEYYGHRENDLVRLPDPTNVLKYPHIAMTTETTSVQGPQINPGMPGDRGYEIIYSNHGGSPQLPSRAFDGNINSTTNPDDCWMTGGGTYNTGDGALASGQTHALTIDGTSRGGSWVGMKMPRKLKLSSVVYYPRHGYGWEIYNGYVVGSNNGTSWDSLLTISAQTGWAANTPKTFTMTNNLNTYYQYFAILATHVQANNTAGRFAIQELEFYGTEEASSIPIQIGGGNIDKVANFRVYDKFVGEDQALEIWDAQKDEFGRAKSSMTLQKGRLGIGTTEPQGRLAVADEPHNLEEFPPRAMTGYKTHFEGHGEFCASASSNNTDTYTGWKAFNKAFFGGEGWMSSTTPDTYTQGTGVPNDTTAQFNGKIGEWLNIDLPYKINLERTTIIQRANSNHPRPTGSFTIWGSNDKVNWDEIITSTHTRTVPVNEPTGDPINRVINISKLYSSYRLQIHNIIVTTGNEDTCHVAEWRLFGTREQGQSVLHDGQLTLTKNLNVPRIGPALDADDTPRRDRLVVEYNTSTNPTFEGAVRDTSGRGNDGVFVGTASYDATEKAFEFDGDSDYLTVKASGVKGSSFNTSYSFSIWVKMTNTASAAVFITVGTSASGEMIGLRMSNGTTRYFVYHFNGDSATTPTTFGVSQEWRHVALTWDNSHQRIYIDGVLAVEDTASSSFLNIPDNPNINLGMRPDGGGSTEYFKGYQSNPKIYDTTLTAEEVKTLYDMGRCDEGHHAVNFSKTRVGIGLGDGEAPRAALDVRGVANFSELEVRGDVRLRGSQSYPNRPVAVVGKSNGRVYDPNVIVYNSVLYNDGNLYNTSNGRFTAPEGYAGYYLITYTGLGGVNETSPNTRWQLNGNDLSWGSAHVNSSPCSSRWGMSCQLIYYLNVGDYLTHRVLSGSIYGSATTHSTTVVMFMGSR